MRNKIDWHPRAEADLAALWLAARDRRRLGEVTARVERALDRLPDFVGESREEGVRVLHDDPLGFVFEIDPQKRVVRIVSVWRYG